MFLEIWFEAQINRREFKRIFYNTCITHLSIIARDKVHSSVALNYTKRNLKMTKTNQNKILYKKNCQKNKCCMKYPQPDAATNQLYLNSSDSHKILPDFN